MNDTDMMNHSNGWMGGWMGGGMWLWTVIGVLVIVQLPVKALNSNQRESRNQETLTTTPKKGTRT